jgi:hypothetical protein
MKRLSALLCFVLLASLRAAPAAPAATAASAAPTLTVLDNRLRDPAFQFEVLRYIYLWYLDDRFFVNSADASSFEIWVRPIQPRTRDAGDQSLYAEMWVPAAGVQLKLKLADYPVPELQRQVKSPGFRIVRAAPLPEAPAPREEYAVFTHDRKAISTFLMDTRNKPQTPGPELRQRLLAALRETVKVHPPADPTARQVFFLSTAPSVSGDIWILWVNEKTAIRFGGEFGADQPDLLSLLPLQTQLFDLSTMVVASLLETEGRTGFITKDWAGRILFQCLVLGERVEVAPEALGLAPAR